MARRIKVLTVGCKANFADSAGIAGEAAACGFAVVSPDASADVIVVNSCAVTHRAERDSRAAARRSRRQNPGATVILTGCCAQAFPGGAAGLPEADHWLPPGDGTAIPALLRRMIGAAGSSGPAASEHAADRLLGHSRTFLKIQDGCDARCAYCVVPRARGPNQSLASDEVLGRAAACEGDGAREIVLTGIRVGTYAADRGERGGLARLLRRLLDRTSRVRFRLSSLEAMEIDEELVELLGGEARLCPHLHIPLQSGSDEVLSRMRRPYRAAHFAAVVERAASRIGDVQIGADVIAGFPGEDRSRFAETVRLLSDLPVHYLHVFPYSAREGTESAGWADDVPPREKKDRARILRDIDATKRSAFRRRQVGKEMEVVAESRDRKDGRLRGYSANYLPVAFPGRPEEVGDLFRVSVASIRGDGTLEGARIDDRN